ncbi:MAG: hypothetical protein CMB03_02425 [Euryarchaeota archaeon]|nr:hypothetical protein [Euryarchaeota archaeon]
MAKFSHSEERLFEIFRFGPLEDLNPGGKQYSSVAPARLNIFCWSLRPLAGSMNELTDSLSLESGLCE